jgi:hypothetical protein
MKVCVIDILLLRACRCQSSSSVLLHCGLLNALVSSLNLWVLSSSHLTAQRLCYVSKKENAYVPLTKSWLLSLSPPHFKATLTEDKFFLIFTFTSLHLNVSQKRMVPFSFFGHGFCCCVPFLCVFPPSLATCS